MSVSPEFMGQKPASSPEKPSFTQACNLLSQYSKEKSSFGDLSLGVTCNVEANGNPEIVGSTINSFPSQMPGNVCTGAPRNLKSMDLFPQRAEFSMPAPTDNGLKIVEPSVTSMNKCAATEPPTAPMTIFYGGQVIVLNDFPADKAKQIMLLATKYSSENPKTDALFTSSVPASPCESVQGIPLTSNNVTLFTSSVPASPCESVQGIPLTSNNVTSHECVQPAKRPADLPIARRASLCRFLEKRKDRITSKAPYQINNSDTPSPPKAGNSKPWLGLAVESLQ